MLKLNLSIISVLEKFRRVELAAETKWLLRSKDTATHHSVKADTDVICVFVPLT